MWQQEVQLTEIQLENTANRSIMHPAPPKNVRTAPKKIQIKGVGGVQMVVDQVGKLDGFFEV
jgi:hypothetical protein